MFKSDFWIPLHELFVTFKQTLIDRWYLLSTIVAGIYLPLKIFEALAVGVAQHEGGFAWDLSILLALHETANAQLDTLAATLAGFGVFWGIFPVATAIALVLILRRKWRSLVYILVTLLGSIAINRTAKFLLHRERPHLWESLAAEFDYAFPSGHAMSSMTLVAVLVFLTWRTRWRWLVLAAGGLFVLAIGWTRLYLGVHYPSDILAGWMVAIAWTVGVSLFLRPDLTNHTDRTNHQSLGQEYRES